VNLSARVTDVVALPGAEQDRRMARITALRLPVHEVDWLTDPAPSPLPDTATRAAAPRTVPPGGVVDLPPTSASWTVNAAWAQHSRCEVDVVAFVVDEEEQVANDDDFIFYGQPGNAPGTVRLTADGPCEQTVAMDVTALPAAARKVVVAAAINGATFGELGPIEITGFDGPITIASASAIAWRTASDGAALWRPQSSTSSTGPTGRPRAGSRIMTQTSTDGGQTWSPPVLTGPGEAVGAFPVIRPTGELVVVFSDWGAHFAARSADGGATFRTTLYDYSGYTGNFTLNENAHIAPGRIGAADATAFWPYVLVDSDRDHALDLTLLDYAQADRRTQVHWHYVEDRDSTGRLGPAGGLVGRPNFGERFEQALGCAAGVEIVQNGRRVIGELGRGDPLLDGEGDLLAMRVVVAHAAQEERRRIRQRVWRRRCRIHRRQ
jgi:hypothetical protein